MTCRLGELFQAIGPVPEGQLGGTRAKNRLTKRVSRTLRIMENVRTANGRFATVGPKKARTLIQAIIRDLERRIAKGKVDASTGNSLLALVRAALDNLQPLIKRR